MQHLRNPVGGFIGCWGDYPRVAAARQPWAVLFEFNQGDRCNTTLGYIISTIPSGYFISIQLNHAPQIINPKPLSLATGHECPG